DARQRREAPLDRARDLLGVRADDLQLLLAPRPVAPAAGVSAETTRHARPLGTHDEHRGRNEQNDGEHGHAPKDSRTADRFLRAGAGTLEDVLKRVAILALTALALAGCGGGGGARPAQTE